MQMNVVEVDINTAQPMPKILKQSEEAQVPKHYEQFTEAEVAR